MERSGARELSWIGTASWHLKLNDTEEPNREFVTTLRYVLEFYFDARVDSNRDTEVVELSGDLHGHKLYLRRKYGRNYLDPFDKETLGSSHTESIERVSIIYSAKPNYRTS